MIEKLNKLEKDINKDSFIYKGDNIWPLFRKIIGWNLTIQQNVQTEEVKINKLKHFSKKLIRLGKLIINFGHILYIKRKYDYIVFTTSDDYRLINDKYINRLTHELYISLNKSKILEIQSAFNPETVNIYDNVKVISNDFFLIASKISSYFVKTDTTMNIIEAELVQHSLTNESKATQAVIKSFLSKSIIFKKLFKYIKPKTIFATCYSFNEILKAGNELGVKTIEFQHGRIVDNFAYSQNMDINNSFYPNYMLTFGMNDKELLIKTKYVLDESKIIPVGNYMIEYYSKLKNEELINLNSEFSITIAVSLQWTVIDEIVEYITSQATKDSSICYILIPRTVNELDKYNFVEKNIKLFPVLNCYEIVANVDYHLTCYSSCVLESPSLGTKNILVNFNNLSRKTFKDYIQENSFNIIIKPSDNIHEIPNIKMKYNKELISESNSNFCMKNYKKNISNFISNELEVNNDNNN